MARLSFALLAAAVFACAWLYARPADANWNLREEHISVSSVINHPPKLRGGKLYAKQGTLYIIVWPPAHWRMDPGVDWTPGFWAYSLSERKAELMLAQEVAQWLDEAYFVSILPDGCFLFHYNPGEYFDTWDDFRQIFAFNPLTGDVKEFSLAAYNEDDFGWHCGISIHEGAVLARHPTFFKVLTLDVLLNEEDSDYVVEVPLYGGKDIMKRQWTNYDLFPLKLADDGVSPFLVLDDEFFGFRILDRKGRLLYQGGQVLPSSFLSGPTSVLPEGLRMADLLRLFYPRGIGMGMVVYMHVGWPQMSDENLIVFYDQYLRCIFVCSPLGDFYKKIDRPSDTWKKHIVGAGLTGEDEYMLLFEDGSYFVADYSDIAEQVRSGKLDPLGPLREMMGLEEE